MDNRPSTALSMWAWQCLCIALLVFVLPLPRDPLAQAASSIKLTAAARAVHSFPAPPMMAPAAALLDVDTGRWLYVKNADLRLPMASTTKIMTAILAIEFGRLNDLYTVSEDAATVGGTSMGLRAGERVSLHDLLYGLMLPSGNDAAVTIAEGVAGSQIAFVHMMNARARDLGLTNTHYMTPHGLDEPGHFTSARDLAIVARRAMQLPLLRKIVNTRTIVIRATRTHHTYDLQNINYFIDWYPGATGVKPGWTPNAGICLVEAVNRNGRHLIGVVLDTPNLYTDIRDLFDYGFNDFSWIHSRTPVSTLDTPDQTITTGLPGDPALYFPATGHSVRAGNLAYFRAHGGITTLGLPLTQEFIENGQWVQYFSNARLVFDQRVQSSIPTPLGLLSVPGKSILRPIKPISNTSWLTYFPQTGHTVTRNFRQFFQTYGGVTTFGYPVTEKLTIHGQLVQYFSNAEFVWHPTGENTGYVSVAALGRDLLSSSIAAPSVRLTQAIQHIPTTQPEPRPLPGKSPTSVPTRTFPVISRLLSPTPTHRVSVNPTITVLPLPRVRPTMAVSIATPSRTSTTRPTATDSPTGTATRPLPTVTPTPAPTGTSIPLPSATITPGTTPTALPVATDTPSALPPPPGNPLGTPTPTLEPQR